MIVTGDRNERTRGYTTADLKRLGARVILLGQFWDRLSRWERTKCLVLHIEKLAAAVNGMQSGQVCLINKRCRERQISYCW